MPPRIPSSAVPRPERLRKGVMATAFAAVIIVGSLTGAQLKQDTQKTEAIKQFRAVNPTDQINMLNEQRKVLVEQLDMMNKKMDIFRERIVEREEEKRAARERAERG